MWFERIQSFLNTSNSCGSTSLWWFTNASNTFESFQTFWICVKLPNSADLLVVQTYSKPLKHIECIWNYLTLPIYLWFEYIWNFWKTGNWFEQISNFQNTSNSSETTLQGWSASGSNRFETYNKRRINEKLLHSGGLQVVQTDLKHSQHIEFM